MDFLSPLGPGDRLGGYTIVRRLGEGGMGVVFEARDAAQRPAALKVLSSWLTTELGRQRFEREVEACAQLEHPNTVRIFDYGEHEGTLFYAMEYLDGFDLRRLVDLDGPQTGARTIRILDQIAGALGEAHEHKLIHRDIKPPNIILYEAGGIPDVAKLVDFGLVMPMLGSTTRRLTLEGHVLGTPRYTAPEMLAPDGRLSEATDFYALGLVAYFLLSGRHAFDGEASAEILKKQRDATAAPLTDVAPDLRSVVEWCLEKDPARRPQRSRDLRDALLSCGDATRWDADAARAWWSAWRDGSGALPEPVPGPREDRRSSSSDRDLSN